VLQLAEAARNRRNSGSRAVFGAVRPGAVQIYMYIAYTRADMPAIVGLRVYIYSRFGLLLSGPEYIFTHITGYRRDLGRCRPYILHIRAIAGVTAVTSVAARHPSFTSGACC
jgi:hypothetical protein